jgi:hypothetical protein
MAIKLIIISALDFPSNSARVQKLLAHTMNLQVMISKPVTVPGPFFRLMEIQLVYLIDLEQPANND